MLTILYSIFHTQGQVTPQSVVESDRNSNSFEAFMVVLVTCENEEHLIKNEGAGVLTIFLPITSLWDSFSDAQGQLTPQSLVKVGRISTSSEILWLSSLPARMKKIQSNMKR